MKNKFSAEKVPVENLEAYLKAVILWEHSNEENQTEKNPKPRDSNDFTKEVNTEQAG